MRERVLVLGGYGTTGRTLCELLLECGDAEVVIAGRSLERGEATARELAERFPGRVTARAADAADAASLARALDGVSMVAVAASVLDHAGTVARAALDAGVDYFDLLLSGEEKFAALERLRPEIEAAGRCFITDGGIHPGLTAAMIRALAPAFGRLERAAAGGLLKVDWDAFDVRAAAPSTSSPTSSATSASRRWRAGAVESRSSGATPRASSTSARRSASQRCSLMYMKELELLPGATAFAARLRVLRLRVQPGRRHDAAAARHGRDEGLAGHARDAPTRCCSPGRSAGSAVRPTAPCSRWRPGARSPAPLRAPACASATPTATGSRPPPRPPACCSGWTARCASRVCTCRPWRSTRSRLLRDLHRMGAEVSARGVDVAAVVGGSAVPA